MAPPSGHLQAFSEAIQVGLVDFGARISLLLQLCNLDVIGALRLQFGHFNESGRETLVQRLVCLHQVLDCTSSVLVDALAGRMVCIPDQVPLVSTARTLVRLGLEIMF